jgi:hypothetical protein
MTVTVRRWLRIAISTLALSVPTLAALPVSPSQAGVVSVSACDGATLTQPFTAWADFDYYKLAPGGNFEATSSSWSLSGGAQQVSGSESYGVTGSVGSSSLALPVGAAAQSPSTCVNAAYPSFRFFVRASGGDVAGVGVQAVYQDVSGNTVVIPVGVAVAGSTWAPTPPMLTGSAIPGAVNGGTAFVSLRFTAISGNAQIDDVEVDPFKS